MATKRKAGRGWHGNSAGHAAAGKKGGKQRGMNARLKKSKDQNMDEDTGMIIEEDELEVM